MITQQGNLLDFVGIPGACFVIPMYQRAYAWTRKQCAELWEDIIRTGRENRTHFMSMVLYVRESAGVDGGDTLEIIDGQQRLATATLLISALAAHLRKTNATVAGLTADDLRTRYLLSPDGTHAKLQLVGTDGATLDALVSGAAMPARTSANVIANREYFAEMMAAEDFDIETFWRGLNHLVLIESSLDTNDKAQAIFESLNTKGIPLATADLVRNYLLVGQSREEQERLYREYWNPIELMFGEDQGSRKLNAGIRMWITLRFRAVRIKDKSQTYNVFKQYMDVTDDTAEDILEELRGFCLMWSENYKFNEVKEFRSMDWIKGKTKTLIPGWGHQSGF